MHKTYYQLINADYGELTEDEKSRKRFVESIPPSVVSALTMKAEQIRAQVMSLEADRDAILDFLSGYWWEGWQDYIHNPSHALEKDGDDE